MASTQTMFLGGGLTETHKSFRQFSPSTKDGRDVITSPRKRKIN